MPLHPDKMSDTELFQALLDWLHSPEVVGAFTMAAVHGATYDPHIMAANKALWDEVCSRAGIQRCPDCGEWMNESNHKRLGKHPEGFPVFTAYRGE